MRYHMCEELYNRCPKELSQQMIERRSMIFLLEEEALLNVGDVYVH